MAPRAASAPLSGLRPSPARRSLRLLPLWMGASLLLHLAVLWLLVPHGMGARRAEVPPEIEIEMVDQAAETRGARAAPPSEPQRQPTPALPQERTGAPHPAPAPRVLAKPGPSAPPSEVNLGAGAEDRDPLQVTGRNVVPPRPDARVHNQPPHYPVAAARRGAEGTVLLLVHVSASGVPSAVEIAHSSGDADLDRAAQDAVALWRFQPARQGASAVPFDYEMRIRFTLGDR